ncbi:MAG: tol-pal system protein YbgF [Elusimicrobiota bacterium]|jgi:tol-pal system protein YbgF|nr:tol-pal system protein YbgF [Elusimicrobiota bacterium]
MKRIFLLINLSILLIAAGCAKKTLSNAELAAEIDKIKNYNQEQQKKYADLYSKSGDSAANIETLNQQVGELQKEVLNLREKINLSQNENKGQNLSYQDILYKESYGDFSAGRYELAYSGFKNYKERYPKSNFAANAGYYMGECFYVRKMWQRALAEYAATEKAYPKAEILPSVMLKKGLCQEQLGNKKEALNTFSLIVKKFPQSEEAAAAGDKIKKNNNASK